MTCPELAVDGIPVVVHVDKFVVGADFLELAVGGEERDMIPEADVLDGQLVAPQVFQGQGVLGGEFPVLDGVQPVGHAGVLSYLFQVRLLQDDLVGGYFKSLDERRVDSRPDDQDGEEGAHSYGWNPPVPAKKHGEDRQAAQSGDDDQNFQHEELGVYVRVPGPEDHSPLRIQHLIQRGIQAPQVPTKKRQAPKTMRCFRGAGRSGRVCGGMNWKERRMK